MRDAPYGVTGEAEARQDVQALAASRPDMIKIWVDDRGGTVEKLKPDLYRAIIAEAHRRGIRVMAHIAALEDAKDLLRAGVDGFGHVVRDKDIDQEFLAMLRERPDVFFVETLWGERNAIYGSKPIWLGEPLLRGTLSDGEMKLLTDGFSAPASTESAQRLLRNVALLNRAGVKLALGTDTGGVTGGGYFGLASLVELELLTKAGLTASQAIVAATRTSAAILGLDALGTVAEENPRPSSCSTRTRSTTSPTREDLRRVPRWRRSRPPRVADEMVDDAIVEPQLRLFGPTEAANSITGREVATSINPQAFQRIHSGRTSRRQIAREQRDCGQNCEDAGEGRGSAASTRYKMPRMSEPSPRPPSTPRIAPTPTSRAFWAAIILRTSPAVAPSAIRMPISCVRWLTA